MPSSTSRPPSPALARLLLALAAAALVAALVTGLGWWRAAHRPVTPEDLSRDQRQQLVTELMEVAAGVHEATWYNPEIGYTLRRAAEVEAWNSTFRTNELGYRTGTPDKAPGTFRVLFVGDSWTFGMGVDEAESFPRVFEELAERHAGLEQPVEAWTLALPGYNTLNQLAALWFFFDRLAPDAVVLVPSSNDNHSLSSVLPNGSLFANGQQPDAFGDPHHVSYPLTYVASHRYRERWRRALGEIAATEARLEELGVPCQLFFLARWKPSVAHHWVRQAGLQAPYQVVPVGLTQTVWTNARPLGHGTVEANQVYAHFVYQGVAENLGWPALPPEALEAPELSSRARQALQDKTPPLHRGPPQGGDWERRAEEILHEQTASFVPTLFVAGEGARRQSAGPLGSSDGSMGRGTTVLLRRPPGVERLEIEVQALAEVRAVLPLELSVRIPAPESPSATTVVVPRPSGGEQPAPLRFEVPLPPEIPAGDALDVVFEASRVAAAEDLLAPRSVRILRIVPR